MLGERRDSVPRLFGVFRAGLFPVRAGRDQGAGGREKGKGWERARAPAMRGGSRGDVTDDVTRPAIINPRRRARPLSLRGGPRC